LASRFLIIFNCGCEERFKNGKVKADWVEGKIISPQGKLLYYFWIKRFDLCHRFRFYCASDFGANCATL